MKRFHIFLLLVTAILGFISCDIRSELIGPLNYSDTLYVYHKDTVYISTVDTLYVDCNCGGNTEGDSTTPDNNPDSTPDTNPDSGSETTPDDGGQNPPSEPSDPVEPEEPEQPAVPIETIIITVDFDENNQNQPFTTNLPGSKKVTTEWESYTLKGTEYTFSFYAPTEGKGYCRQAIKEKEVIVDYALRLEGVYMQMPAIEGFTLTNAEITGGNSSGNKAYNFYLSVPKQSEEKPLWTLQVNTTNTKSVSLTGAQSGVGYMMKGDDANAQFSKLVLIYGKFE